MKSWVDEWRRVCDGDLLQVAVVLLMPLLFLLCSISIFRFLVFLLRFFWEFVFFPPMLFLLLCEFSVGSSCNFRFRNGFWDEVDFVMYDGGWRSVRVFLVGFCYGIGGGWRSWSGDWRLFTKVVRESQEFLWWKLRLVRAFKWFRSGLENGGSSVISWRLKVRRGFFLGYPWTPFCYEVLCPSCSRFERVRGGLVRYFWKLFCVGSFFCRIESIGERSLREWISSSFLTPNWIQFGKLEIG